MSSSRVSPFARASVVWISLFLLGGIAVPLLAVASRVESWATLGDPVVLALARMTAFQALVSAAFSCGLGLPLGLWVGRLRSEGRGAGRWAARFLALPYGVPSVVAGFAWVAWLGRSGALAALGIPLDWAYSFKAVVLAHVVFNVPLVALLVSEARVQLPDSRLEAAETLGAGPGARLRFVIFPGIRWALASALCQVVALCSMSFALVLILGGGPPVATLETALYQRVRSGSLDLGGAAACALWELAITLTPWVFVMLLRSRRPVTSRATGPRRVRTAGGRGLRAGGGLFAALVSALFLAPYLIVFLGSPFAAFSDPEVRAGIAGPLLLSIQLALLTGLAALVTAGAGVAALSALGSRPWLAGTLSVLLAVPGGVSVLVLGLGFWLAYGRWLDPFSGSFGAMLALQAAVLFPVAFRMLWPVAQTSGRPLTEVALTLGASPARAFLAAEWPRWRTPLFTAFAVVAGAALGEVAAVSLFYSENLVPLPLLIQRAMSQYHFEEARAISALLFMLSTATIGLATRMER